MKKLTPPCSYQGGKQRLAKQIIDIIFERNKINENTKFICDNALPLAFIVTFFVLEFSFILFLYILFY